MSGNPISQVKEALNHIINLTKNIKLIDLAIITYDNAANILDIKDVSSITAGGGTSFMSAFQKIDDLL